MQKSMQITRKITVPTGQIFTAEDERGRPVECLWVQDYGKNANLKADFLGLHENIQEVKHQNLLSPHEKLVTTVSSQNGCSMGCVFCLHPESKINTPDGLKEIQHLRVGDYVYGADESGNVTIQQIVETMKNDFDNDIYNIELENGNVIQITGNHEVMTTFGWKLAKDLTTMDELIHI